MKFELKEVIFKNDWNQSLQKAHSHCSTIIIAINCSSSSNKLDEDTGCDIGRILC